MNVNESPNIIGKFLCWFPIHLHTCLVLTLSNDHITGLKNTMYILCIGLVSGFFPGPGGAKAFLGC